MSIYFIVHYFENVISFQLANVYNFSYFSRRFKTYYLKLFFPKYLKKIMQNTTIDHPEDLYIILLGILNGLGKIYMYSMPV